MTEDTNTIACILKICLLVDVVLSAFFCTPFVHSICSEFSFSVDWLFEFCRLSVFFNYFALLSEGELPDEDAMFYQLNRRNFDELTECTLSLYGITIERK